MRSPLASHDAAGAAAASPLSAPPAGGAHRAGLGRHQHHHGVVVPRVRAGLDSAVTYDIVASLKARAKERGCAYVISLLQPTPETYGLFDEVVLLREGGWRSECHMRVAGGRCRAKAAVIHVCCFVLADCSIMALQASWSTTAPARICPPTCAAWGMRRRRRRRSAQPQRPLLLLLLSLVRLAVRAPQRTPLLTPAACTSTPPRPPLAPAR